MTEKEADILNKLHGCSGWLKRARKKYYPYLDILPAAGNNALFQGQRCVEEAIKILLEGGKDVHDAAG